MTPCSWCDGCRAHRVLALETHTSLLALREGRAPPSPEAQGIHTRVWRALPGHDPQHAGDGEREWTLF